MKTYIKCALILLATLSVSGCFSEDDKSYVESVETSQEASQEVIEEASKYLIECWMGDTVEPTHYFEVDNIFHRYYDSTNMRLPDGSILPVNNCLVFRK